jgi:hypothetical protein
MFTRRDNIDSQFDKYNIAEDNINVDFVNNDRTSNSMYDHVLRVTGLQQQIQDSNNKLNSKYKPETILETNNKAYVTDVANKLRDYSMETYQYYLEAGLSQKDAEEKTKNDVILYKKLLENKFKAKYRYGVKEAIENVKY